MKKHIAYIALLIISISTSFGQSACFTVDIVKGCVPLTVKVTNCSALTTTPTYKFGDGSPSTTSTTHTYSGEGTFTITQTIFFNATPYTYTQTVQVIKPTSPTFIVQVCENRVVNVNITDIFYDQYLIDFGDGSNQTVGAGSSASHTYASSTQKNITVTGSITGSNGCQGINTKPVTPLNALITPDIYQVIVLDQSSTVGKVSIVYNAASDQHYVLQYKESTSGTYTNDTLGTNLSGQQTVTISNLNTQNKQYCFKLFSYDECNNTKTSPEICSIINNVTSNDQNDLVWTSPNFTSGVKDFSIKKDNVVLVSALPSTTTTYTDLNVKCGAQNCYQIISNLNALTTSTSQSLQSISANQCVIGISTKIPPAVLNLNSTINGSSAEISWDKPTSASVKKYSIYRSENSSTFSNNSSSTINKFSDSKISIPGNTYCYQIIYTDSCSKDSPLSTTTCPCILSLSVDPSNNFQNNLSWSTYTGSWTTSPSYTFERIDEGSTVLNSIPMGSGLSHQDIISNNNVQVVRYRIKVTGGAGEVSYSNIVDIKYEGAVFLPNAFTPNGDGNNDHFSAKVRFIKDYHLTIFNRWGEAVFDTENINYGWDGTYNGNAANPDAYAYLVQATDLWGKTFTQRGSVTLIR